MESEIILFIVSIPSIYFGFFLFRRPLDAFEIQRCFYAKINWKIEPISVSKEVRNTKGMGIIVIAFNACALIYFYLLR